MGQRQRQRHCQGQQRQGQSFWWFALVVDVWYGDCYTNYVEMDYILKLICTRPCILCPCTNSYVLVLHTNYYLHMCLFPRCVCLCGLRLSMVLQCLSDMHYKVSFFFLYRACIQAWSCSMRFFSYGDSVPSCPHSLSLYGFMRVNLSSSLYGFAYLDLYLK